MNIDEYIYELRETIITAKLNYDVWRVYTGEDTRPRYIDVINRYVEFFSVSHHAHFVATLITLYRLYETRENTYNIPTLLRIMAKEPRVKKRELLDEANEMYEHIKPLWRKVSILRNNAFGHRSNMYAVDEVFEKAGITPNELNNLITITENLLNKLGTSWSGKTYAFNRNCRNDTIRVLSDLASTGGLALTPFKR